MQLRQTWKNYAAQVLLELDLPVLTPWVRRWLVDRHVAAFVDRSAREGEARRTHLRALFDAAVTVYRRALAVGYPESEAREITHILATWDFQNHGWGELIEFPPGERWAYYRRYREFFDRHDMTPDDPLGDFAPPGGLPAAPATPERMTGDYPMAKAGLTDDVYVVRGDWEVRLRCVADRQRASRQQAPASTETVRTHPSTDTESGPASTTGSSAARESETSSARESETSSARESETSMATGSETSTATGSETSSARDSE